MRYNYNNSEHSTKTMLGWTCNDNVTIIVESTAEDFVSVAFQSLQHGTQRSVATLLQP